MKKPAFEWIEIFLLDFIKNKNNVFLAQLEIKEIFEFYDKFQEKIKKIFNNADEKLNAERRLKNLIQITSAVYYAFEF